MKYKIIWLLCISLYAWGEENKTICTPSFDCKNVKKQSVEAEICEYTSLCELDNYVKQLYKSFYLLTPELKETQQKWIKKRNLCQKKHYPPSCLSQSYHNRIKILEKSFVTQEEFSKDMLDIVKSLHRRVQTKKDTESPRCMHIFKDLFLFQNMHVVEPMFDKVDYNNTQLKKAMGSCWEMYRKQHFYGSADSVSLWLSDVDGDKQKEFLFGRNDRHGTKIYILDKKLCDYMIHHPSLKKYKTVAVEDYDAHMQFREYFTENTILEYKGKGYTFEAHFYRTPSAITDPTVKDVARKNELIMDWSSIGNHSADGCMYHERKE